MTEGYLGQSRVSLTRLNIYPMSVTKLKAQAGDLAPKAQVSFTKATKSSPKANRKVTLKEIPFVEGMEQGASLDFRNSLEPGTIITVQGISKGKGFAGVVKRHGFAGGARTHGQSDRHRAPGSIGQGTTPGRVHRGKKMAGRMGNDTVTIKNLTVVANSDDSIWVTGPVPGNKHGLIKITVTGTTKLTSPVIPAAPAAAPSNKEDQ